MIDVSFHPDADAELLEATDWYLKRSLIAATGFIQAVDHAIARIAENPLRYPVTRFGRRRFVLISYPYDLVYRIRQDEVEVVAIAHHARRPGYWRNR